MSKNLILEMLFSFVIYGIFLATIFFFFHKSINAEILKIKKRSVLKRRMAEEKQEHKNTIIYLIIEHLKMLIDTVTIKKISPKVFILFSVTLCILTIILTMRILNPMALLLLSFVVLLAPYTYLRIKIENIRHKSSFEAENVVGGFLNQYRIKNFNVMEAIETEIAADNNIKYTKKLLFTMLLELRQSKSKDSAQNATRNFAVAVGTNWAKMFAHCINEAFVSGINVSNAMEDILIELKEAKELLEERKRINAESTRMIKYVLPVSYFASIYLSVKSLDVPLEKIMRNQLTTSEGISLLMTILIMFFINVVLIEFIKNKRFDF